MQVLAVDGRMARCSANGIERDVSLFLLPEDGVTVGEFVIVHVGYAIQKMTAEEARSTWELLDQILAAEQASSHA